MMEKGDIVVSRLSHLPNAIGYYEGVFGTGSLHIISLLHRKLILSESIQAVYRYEFQHIGNLDLINYINIL